MRTTIPLLLSLLLTSAPAFAGNDFCDSIGGFATGTSKARAPDPDMEDRKGGECKSTLRVSSTLQQADRSYWRIRNLPYTPRNMQVLHNFDSLQQLRLELRAAKLPLQPALPVPGGPTGPRGESTFLEWSFLPADPLDPRQRVLILTAVSNGTQLFLRGDWVQPRDSGWSMLDKPRGAVDPLGSGYLALGPAEPFETVHMTLLREKGRIRVGVGQPVARWLDFDAADAAWQPERLRSGLLDGTPLSAGEGLELYWSDLPYRMLSDDTDGIVLPPDSAS